MYKDRKNTRSHWSLGPGYAREEWTLTEKGIINVNAFRETQSSLDWHPVQDSPKIHIVVWESFSDEVSRWQDSPSHPALYQESNFSIRRIYKNYSVKSVTSNWWSHCLRTVTKANPSLWPVSSLDKLDVYPRTTLPKLLHLPTVCDFTAIHPWDGHIVLF